MPEKELVPFRFNGQLVRAEIIDDDPWFIAKDACDILGIQNISQAVGDLDDDEKLIYPLDISGQNRQTWLVNEPGIYELVFRSRKPDARAFRRWIAHEVIPQIRKFGSYEPETTEDMITTRELAHICGSSLDNIRGYAKRLGFGSRIGCKGSSYPYDEARAIIDEKYAARGKVAHDAALAALRRYFNGSAASFEATIPQILNNQNRILELVVEALNKKR